MLTGRRLHRYTYAEYVGLELDSRLAGSTPPTSGSTSRRSGWTTFPDGTVICGPLEQHPPSPKATALNPLVLVEAYRTIPSLRDYVVVAHRERRITVHHRGDDGGWSTRVAIAGGQVEVDSLGGVLVVDEVYRRSQVT